MATRYFALILGLAFLLVASLGFLEIGSAPPGNPADGDVHATMQHHYLLGLFPVNIWHNLVHLIFGIWGVGAYGRFDASRLYARVVAVAYGLLAIMGLLPPLNTAFGWIPIHGNDVWLHGVIAIAAAYFGFARVPQADSGPEARQAGV